MSGPVHALEAMIAGMDAHLDTALYLYCRVKDWAAIPSGLTPFAAIQEDEGLTLVVTTEQATAYDLEGSFECRRIVLMVHSALEGVGLTAAVAACLTQKNIPANIIAGYYHDHVFVPARQAEAALHALRDLQRASTKRA